MEKDTSKKFVCKYCDKKYPCGKSLGGHLRSHRMVSNNSVDDDEKAKLSELFNRNVNSNMEMKYLNEVGEQAQSQTAYLLREKPKKTWRFSNLDGGSSLQQQPQLLKICKECGKGFQSVKALCGHMACHSEKDKQKVVVDDNDESDSELSGLRQTRTRRSKRMRGRALDVYTSLVNGDYSSVSESEQEQEEVALCLMMLSRDTRKYVGVSSLESSDNNSAKSSSAETKIIGNGRLTRIPGFVEYKENKNRKGRAFGDVSNDADAEYFGGDINYVESDNSGELFLRDIEVKKPNVRHGSGFQGSVYQSKCIPNGFGHSKCSRGKNSIEEEECKEQRDELLKNFVKSENGSPYNVKVYRNTGCESMNWSNENTQDTDPCYAQTSLRKPSKSDGSKLGKKKKSSSNSGKNGSRKRKGHQCPFCSKIFKSGQALGGHKRIHFLGGDLEDRAVMLKQEMRSFLDLNLPASSEEEVDGPW